MVCGHYSIPLQGKTTGQDLLDTIYKYLNLIETTYFGLRYQDNANQTVSRLVLLILIIPPLL